MRSDGITLVFLSQGKVAIIDSVDADAILPHRWYAYIPRNGVSAYARRVVQKQYKRTHIHMHRVILERMIGALPDGIEPDHINRNKLDNRRCNLRPATRGSNVANNPRRRDNTSGYRGVYWNKGVQKWQAQIQKDGKMRYLGIYDDIEQAARAYDDAAIELHGQFATPNFER